MPAANISLDSGWGKCDACNDVFSLADAVEGYRPGQPASTLVERPFDAWATSEHTRDRLAIIVPPCGMRAAAGAC